jgi:hypothetical protein
MSNTPVGNTTVNNSKLIKLKGQLGFPLKTKSPSGATAGGTPPQKKLSHFFAKNSIRKRAKYDSTLASSEFRRGVGGQAERTREPERAYASARIRPFSLAFGPAGYSRNRTPPTRIHPSKGKTEHRNKREKKCYLNLQVLQYFKSLLVYLHGHAAQITNIQTKKAKCPAIFRLGARRRQERRGTRTP